MVIPSLVTGREFLLDVKGNVALSDALGNESGQTRAVRCFAGTTDRIKGFEIR